MLHPVEIAAQKKQSLQMWWRLHMAGATPLAVIAPPA